MALSFFLSFLPSFLDLSPRASVSDSVNSLNRDSLQPSDVRGASRAFFLLRFSSRYLSRPFAFNFDLIYFSSVLFVAQVNQEM